MPGRTFVRYSGDVELNGRWTRADEALGESHEPRSELDNGLAASGWKRNSNTETLYSLLDRTSIQIKF